MCLLVLGLVACREEPPTSVPSDVQLRLVTLAPALTQMIADLGHADRLVGVTDKDTAAPEGVPVVGNYVELDHERLLSVRPTHVLQMVPRGGISSGLMNLGRQHDIGIVAYPYPKTIAEVADMLTESHGETPSLGQLLEDEPRAALAREAFVRFFSSLRTLTASAPRPRVLLVIGIGPVMASGPGTVHDELLAYAGGLNVAASAAVTAPTYDNEALIHLNPQVVLLLSPGRENVDADAMAALLPELAQLPIDAVRDGRLTLINDPATLLPSTSLPRIAAALTRAVHPELSGEVDRLLMAYDAALDRQEAGHEPAP